MALPAASPKRISESLEQELHSTSDARTTSSLLLTAPLPSPSAMSYTQANSLFAWCPPARTTSYPTQTNQDPPQSHLRELRHRTRRRDRSHHSTQPRRTRTLDEPPKPLPTLPPRQDQDRKNSMNNQSEGRGFKILQSPNTGNRLPEFCEKYSWP